MKKHYLWILIVCVLPARTHILFPAFRRFEQFQYQLLHSHYLDHHLAQARIRHYVAVLFIPPWVLWDLASVSRPSSDA